MILGETNPIDRPGIFSSFKNSFIETRGQQWAGNAPGHIPDATITKLWVPTKNFVQSKGGKVVIALALVTLIGYVAFRSLAKKGETQAMPVRGYNEVVFSYEDGTTKTSRLDGINPVTVEGDGLKGISGWDVREVDATESHVRNIDQLTTREQVVGWLITYQHLTADGNGKDVIRGTAGAGLATVLRGAMFGEALQTLDNTATAAIVETLKELRTKGELPILNSKDLASALKLQEIETRQHRLKSPTYDAFGKTMANLSPELRTFVAWMASGFHGLPKAALGLTTLKLQ